MISIDGFNDEISEISIQFLMVAEGGLWKYD